MSFPNGFGSGFGFGFLSESGVSDDVPEAQQAIPSQTGGASYAGQPKTTGPSDLSGLVAWYRGDAGITIATGVSAWADQSGTGDANKNMAQATGSAQPTFTAADAAYNGQPTLSFASASSQFLQSAAWSVAATEPRTIVIVGNFDGSATAQYMMDALTVNQSVIRNGGATAAGMYAGTLISAAVATGSPMAMVAVFTASGSLYINAKTVAASGDPGNATMDGITVGAAGSGAVFLNGKVAEVIVYNRALTAGEAASLLTYCGTKYNITIGA